MPDPSTSRKPAPTSLAQWSADDLIVTGNDLADELRTLTRAQRRGKRYASAPWSETGLPHVEIERAITWLRWQLGTVTDELKRRNVAA